MRSVYLDNAATTNPKPKAVIDAMVKYLEEVGASPGRGGYRSSLEAGRILYDTRIKLKKLFNAPDEEHIIFTHNITYGLNFVLMGFLEKNDHVITTSMEHNSVIRPLRFLEKTRGIKLTIIKGDSKGRIDPQDLKKALRDDTKMIVITHASNVTGTVMPIEEIAKIKAGTDAVLALDTAQTAGVLDLDFEKLNLDALAFTGHKGLYGPQGTGGLVLSEDFSKSLSPLIHGGTGSRSDLEFQPELMPDKFEAGTSNMPGISGLSAALDFLNSRGLKDIREHESKLTKSFINGLCEIKNVKVYGPKDIKQRVSTVSIGVDGCDMGELSYLLDSDYGVMTRSGLHCAPLAHKTIGTFPEGTLRFSFGIFNTEDDVEYAITALQKSIDKLL